MYLTILSTPNTQLQTDTFKMPHDDLDIKFAYCTFQILFYELPPFLAAGSQQNWNKHH